MSVTCRKHIKGERVFLGVEVQPSSTQPGRRVSDPVTAVSGTNVFARIHAKGRTKEVADRPAVLGHRHIAARILAVEENLAQLERDSVKAIAQRNADRCIRLDAVIQRQLGLRLKLIELAGER